ncbi:hypothetical protein Pcaca05_33530 [Pectobacterium carotovorum subsp. carotovorum]|nr:hypothetical protein Pcaca05_33530 [Pectobacterium carotovorum subsp. carotovorum]
MAILIPMLGILAASRTPAPLSHFGYLVFDAESTGFIGVGEQKYALAVTTEKSVMTFRVLTMMINLNGLTVGK